ncbi:glycosyltransferase family protein, partial [Neokomagataea anthophila]
HFVNKRFVIAPSTPVPRTFDAALAGAFLVFHEATHEIRRYFRADEIPTFSHRTDVEKLVQTYLNDDAKRLS